MLINFSFKTKILWHSDCIAGKHSSPMVEVSRQEGQSLLECVACGKRGYYPHGKSGRIEVDEVNVAVLHSRRGGKLAAMKAAAKTLKNKQTTN